MASYSSSTTKSSSTTSSKQTGKSQSVTQNVLDEKLLATILSGLSGGMTQEEIAAFAESLLRPQLNAGLEAAKQQHETTKLSKEQEIANLAASLSGSIAQQRSAYARSMADVQTAALARGMGRSSYTLERLAQQGDALSQAVMALTQENERKSAQLKAQITQSAQQSEQTQARLNESYAAQLAAKIQELTQEQRKEKNSNYLTAISAAMGKKTTGTSETKGESHTESTSTTTKTSGKTGGGGSSSRAKKQEEEIVDAVSFAAPSLSRWR